MANRVRQPTRVVQVLGDGPGDGEAVIGGRAAADLVEDDQRVVGGVVEDVGGLAHLDHEGGLAAREVVAGADAGEDAIDEADARLAGGDAAADLRHEGDERDLADVGGFAGHVGAGDEQDLVDSAFELGVVGHERADPCAGFRARGGGRRGCRFGSRRMCAFAWKPEASQSPRMLGRT